MGGRPVDLTARPLPRCRAVYGLVDRVNFPDLLRTFDVPNPDKTIAFRPESTIPQQALFFLNNELVVEQARKLARRSAPRRPPESSRSVGSINSCTRENRRLPRCRLAEDFLTAATAPSDATIADPPAEYGWQYGSGAFDPATRRVQHFQRLPAFAGDAWHDATNGVRLTAEGGTNGHGDHSAAIRRWVALQDGLNSA